MLTCGNNQIGSQEGLIELCTKVCGNYVMSKFEFLNT